MRITAALDPALAARVIRSIPLRYADGADPSLDRPAHVRSASGIVRFGGRIAVIQDDANFIALIDPDTGLADAITLPAGEGGLRQFDDLRGNKRFKLDLESCVVIGDTLIAFGSGSLPARERVVAVRGGDARVIDASALYARLRAAGEFSGSELNVEGAAVLGGTLRLFNRGNGAPRDGRLPVNASCDVDLAAFLAYLDGAPAPSPAHVVQYDLGAIRGFPLTFTDAVTFGDAVLYSAAAEDSPDATRDGPVAGAAIGIIAGDTVRYGEVDAGKIEGLLPLSPDRLLAVIDPDNPTLPSRLLEVAVSSGPSPQPVIPPPPSS
jgi:hypothetical protein